MLSRFHKYYEFLILYVTHSVEHLKCEMIFSLSLVLDHAQIAVYLDHQVNTSDEVQCYFELVDQNVSF